MCLYMCHVFYNSFYNFIISKMLKILFLLLSHTPNAVYVILKSCYTQIDDVIGDGRYIETIANIDDCHDCY